jgi:hypothetical protein
MKKYYARYKYSFTNGARWKIYKKRKWFFDKKVSEFYSTSTTSEKDYKYFVEPVLKRLEAE